MSTSDSSTSARRDGSARDAVESAAYDITDAIEATTEFLAGVDDYDFSDSSELDAIDQGWMTKKPLTVGHLRAILAALSAPYVPGMVEVDEDAWGDGDPGVTFAKLSVWPPDGRSREDRYFAQVSR